MNETPVYDQALADAFEVAFNSDDEQQVWVLEQMNLDTNSQWVPNVAGSSFTAGILEALGNEDQR